MWIKSNVFSHGIGNKNSGPVQFISELTYFRNRFGEKAEFLETGLYLLHYKALLKYQPQNYVALSRATIFSIL
jgi:hypothetical protein